MKDIDATLYFQYRNLFECIITYAFGICTTILKTAAGEMYDLGSLSGNEINRLMRKSIEINQNLLLEIIKTKYITPFSCPPNADY